VCRLRKSRRIVGSNILRFEAYLPGGRIVDEATAPTVRRPGMLKVVVVDDHEAMRQAVSAALTHAGDIEVIGTCADGQEAVVVATQMHPDVVVMDLSMPRMNGIDATREIVRRDPAVRVLICTGAAPQWQIDGAVDAGAVGCVYKSLDLSEIVAAVRSAAMSPL
jgi:DNA-binding NarL/FixJ family response regulator